ncbi:hypothetical protein N7533_013491 [Penicillium manginii]|uniref:uncharacterized protein n=1 Tax=Penicillium manginii TaxID=203109 RepID=UPI0025486347|nr:uncharacterized protein N7533_013491 [Penicillium manginii]KAJ5733044.1 hypothetical protein N7533_013491 [Penicillium manginii]
MSGPPPPNGPPDYDPNRQPYPHWNGQGQSPEDHQHQPPYPYPPPGSSYPPSDQDRAYYPPPQYPPPGTMAAIHPHAQPQDAYRLPPPRELIVPIPMANRPRRRSFTIKPPHRAREQPLPVGTVAVASDGRCTNCIRFNQECMFTPVSSQAQAFVPAQVAYPHLRNQQAGGRGSNPGMTLYGAHGQPLPPQQQPDSTLPPPQGMYHPYGRPPMDGAPQPLASSMPDPRQPGRRSSGSGFDYPDPTNLAPVTPASAPGYQGHTAPGPYHPTPHDRRTSPQSSYGYDARHSSSPHSSPYPPMTQGGPTPPPPPTSTPGGSARSGLNVRDMLNPGNNDPSQGRSTTDSDMLNALNRRGPQ